jgi:hypothetical protein
MRVIELDASGRNKPEDFYNALLPEPGAPDWHGHNLNALNGSVIWGGINAVNPPLTIRIRGLGGAPKAVADEVKLASGKSTKVERIFAIGMAVT